MQTNTKEAADCIAQMNGLHRAFVVAEMEALHMGEPSVFDGRTDTAAAHAAFEEWRSHLPTAWAAALEAEGEIA